MKKIFTSSLFCLFGFATSAFSEGFILLEGGAYGSRPSIDQHEDYTPGVGIQIKSDSTAGKIQYTANSSATVSRILSTSEAKDHFQFAGVTKKLIVDADSAVENTTVVDVSQWSQIYTTSTIQNSASSTALMIFNFGSELKIDYGSSNTQSMTFKNINAQVNATNVYVGSNSAAGTSKITIDNGATVDLRVSTVTSNAENKVNSSFDVNTGGTLKISQNVKFSDTVLNLYGTVDVSNSSGLDLKDGSIMNINTGAKLISNGGVNTNRIRLYGATINLNGYANDDSDLRIVVADSDGQINVKADSKIYNLYLASSGSKIILEDTVSLLEIELFESMDSKTIGIYNFKDGVVKIGNTLSDKFLNGHITVFDVLGNELLGSLSLEGGFLTLVAVPEPAEWAAIFGAIALGLAVYRRRK